MRWRNTGKTSRSPCMDTLQTWACCFCVNQPRIKNPMFSVTRHPDESRLLGLHQSRFLPGKCLLRLFSTSCCKFSGSQKLPLLLLFGLIYRPDFYFHLTFMFHQQLVVELHHSLVLLQLQQALAEVESQRKTHFLQRFQVLRLSVHLQVRGGQGVIKVS